MITTAFLAFVQGMPSFMFNRWIWRSDVDRIQPKGEDGVLVSFGIRFSAQIFCSLAKEIARHGENAILVLGDFLGFLNYPATKRHKLACI